jgi:uncharacterized protein (DUF302 family)
MRYLTALLLLLAALPGLALEKVSPEDSPFVVYRSTENYEEIKESLELAITGQGLIVSGNLHISDMLNRTASDTGFKKKIYRKAESIEFCSVVMSHRMVAAHPYNLGICPFTIALYINEDDPEHLYVAYRRPVLAGGDMEVQKAVEGMIEGIIQEAFE